MKRPLIKFHKDKTIITNSYLLTKEEIKQIVDTVIPYRELKDLHVTRSEKSYKSELKAHIRLYKLHLFRKHTKNCDLEENIKLWKEIVYRIIGF